MIHQRRSLTHIFLRKDFLFSKELYMLHYINAVYYPHHPNMMVRIYNIIIKQGSSNHVGEFQTVIPLYNKVFLYRNDVRYFQQVKLWGHFGSWFKQRAVGGGGLLLSVICYVWRIRQDRSSQYWRFKRSCPISRINNVSNFNYSCVSFVSTGTLYFFTYLGLTLVKLVSN